LISSAKNYHFVKATELQELEARPSHQVHINVVTFHEKSGLTCQRYEIGSFKFTVMSHDEATASPLSEAQRFSNHSFWPAVTFLLVI